MTAPKYRPPLRKGQPVRLTTEYSGLPAGTVGVITWTHPNEELPYRVQWEGAPKPGPVVFGMDDIGWLMKPHEIEPYPEELGQCQHMVAVEDSIVRFQCIRATGHADDHEDDEGHIEPQEVSVG